LSVTKMMSGYHGPTKYEGLDRINECPCMLTPEKFNHTA
jgi:hypothetical protein